MPRPRLESSMEKAPRLSIRVTQEIKDIVDEQKDKSKFVREAILHYSKYVSQPSENNSRSDSSREYRTISNNIIKKKEEPSPPKVRTYQPAWKR